MKKIYDLPEIRARVNCREIAEALGLPKRSNGRYAAIWRGGTNGNVAIENDKWYDHKGESGGGAFELVQTVRGGSFSDALEWIAQLYHIEPKSELRPAPGPSRIDTLKDEGYEEKATYRYTDAGGNLVQVVVRMEHPERGKEFVQGDGKGKWTLKHVTPVLYNLPNIISAKTVYIVEGEKDADTLINWQIAATTNAGGAKNWKDSFSDTLAGKDIIILPDNDESGQLHAATVAKSLRGKAKSIRAVTLSKLPKGDVTDWIQKEGGNLEEFIQAVQSAPEYTEPDNEAELLLIAKEANREPLCNFQSRWEKDDKGKNHEIKEPRIAHALVEDVHRRFLNFPRVVGQDTMFDHDRDTGEIQFIENYNQFFSWMQDKSKNHVYWTRGDGMITKQEFYEKIRTHAMKYESISSIPDYPTRSEVYYSHPELPEPSERHKIFHGLIDFFLPVNPAFKTLLSAMFCAPLYYIPGVHRPLWIIDSPQGQGTGKSTVAQMIAKLYGNEVLEVSPQDLKMKMEEVTKRMLTNEGRSKRICLIDNVVGNFTSPQLAKMITLPAIGGIRKYGRNEENRPNNFTYIVTSNNAKTDSDIISRAFFVDILKPKSEGDWVSRIQNYITTHRLQIFADMVDLIKNGPKYESETFTRFPDFERAIIHPQCKSLAELKAVYAEIRTKRDTANHDLEIGQEVEEIVQDRLSQLPVMWQSARFWVPSKTLYFWCKGEIEAAPDSETAFNRAIRELVNNGTIQSAKAEFEKFPHHSDGDIKKSRGLMWYGPNATEKADTYVITYTPDDKQKNAAVRVS